MIKEMKKTWLLYQKYKKDHNDYKTTYTEYAQALYVVSRLYRFDINALKK